MSGRLIEDQSAADAFFNQEKFTAALNDRRDGDVGFPARVTG